MQAVQQIRKSGLLSQRIKQRVDPQDQQPGIAETVNLDHIKRHYYITHTQINPTRIVPIGPLFDLTKPHDRERLN